MSAAQSRSEVNGAGLNRYFFDPNRSRTSLPATDRLGSPRCSLTASCRYDILMILVEENGFYRMPPNCGGEMR